jgi:hypothetical protein
MQAQGKKVKRRMLLAKGQCRNQPLRDFCTQIRKRKFIRRRLNFFTSYIYPKLFDFVDLSE